MNRLLRCVVFFGFYLFSFCGISQPVLDLRGEWTKHELHDYIYMLEDPTRSLSVNDVAGLSFKPLPSKIIGENFSTSNTWFRLIVITGDKNEWLFESENVFLDSVYYYVPVNNGYKESFLGLSKMVSERTHKSPSYLFEIPDNIEADTLYFKTTPSILSELTLSITTKAHHADIYIYKIIGYALVCGLYFLYMIINLMFYYHRRRSIFIILVLYSTVSLAMILHIMGIAHILYYPEVKWIYNDLFYVLLDLSFFVSLIFTFKLFQTDPLNRQFRFLYLTFSCLWLLSITSDFMYPVDGSVEGLIVHHTFPLISLVIQGSIGFYLWRKGNRNAFLYSIGWSIYAILVIIFTAKDMGFLPSNSFIRNIPSFAGIIEVLFFTIASVRSLIIKETESVEELGKVSKELTLVRKELKNYISNSAKESGSQVSAASQHLEVLKKLSPREFDILQKMFEGKSNPEIADETFVSVNTVKTHIKSIYNKLEVHNRVELVKKLSGS